MRAAGPQAADAGALRRNAREGGLTAGCMQRRSPPGGLIPRERSRNYSLPQGLSALVMVSLRGNDVLRQNAAWPPGVCRRRLFDAGSSSILPCPNNRAPESHNDWTTTTGPPQSGHDIAMAVSVIRRNEVIAALK